MSERIASKHLASKVMTADEAAEFVNHGDTVGMSGSTGATYPKTVPTAIANRAKQAREKGNEFTINLIHRCFNSPGL